MYVSGEKNNKQVVVMEGLTRKLLSYGGNIMSVLLEFQDGVGMPVHSHYHEQNTYIISGLFTLTLGGTVYEVKAGDSFYVEPNIIHGLKCIKAGKVIDTFTPQREDLLLS